MQHVVGVAQGNAQTVHRRSGLQARTHAGNGAVVVGALDVDHLGEAALPLGQVVSHVGHKVGVAAVGLAHHTVFVVAVVGALEPQRAVLFVGFASGLQLLNCVVHTATGVEAAFKVIVVELDLKGFQVQVLLVAQIGHGKLAHAIEVIDIAAACELAVVGLDRFLGQKVSRDVGNIVPVVGRSVLATGPLRVPGLEALRTQLGAGGQGIDLHTCVVVIELAVDIETLSSKQIANRVAQSGLTTMAHMQGPGGVGRDKLHQHALAVVGLKAKTVLRRQHLAHHLLLGSGLEADVDEARAGNFNVLHPLLEGGRSQQSLAQLLTQLAGVEFEWFGQLHGRGDGEVAMGRHFGRFKSGLVA